MEEKLYLNPEEILRHEFKIDARGYRMQEVDRYLDMVIRDYTELIKTIKSLENENRNLREDNRKISAEYRRLKEEISASDTGMPNGNTDLLRRLSNLEKITINASGLNPDGYNNLFRQLSGNQSLKYFYDDVSTFE